jgi:hypothetical protein
VPAVYDELLISAESLRPATPAGLPASTADVAPLSGIAGQSRAVEAIRFGLALEAPGYHIAVSGLPQSGADEHGPRTPAGGRIGKARPNRLGIPLQLRRAIVADCCERWRRPRS